MVPIRILAAPRVGAVDAQSCRKKCTAPQPLRRTSLPCSAAVFTIGILTVPKRMNKTLCSAT